MMEEIPSPKDEPSEVSMNRLSAGENWACPHCGVAQVLDGSRLKEEVVSFPIQPSALGKNISLFVQAISCANNKCRDLTLKGVLFATTPHKTSIGTVRVRPKSYGRWTLRPVANAKPQPECVPEPLKADYYEACAIQDLSPKASATLARRCLQGAIRDFCGIVRGRLIDEIDDLDKLVKAGKPPNGVEADTVEAIDAVRRIGNIGAHMEKDINIIVDVDPNEAQLLIELIELVFAEWYVARDRRQNLLSAIKRSAEDKVAAKNLSTPAKVINVDPFTPDLAPGGGSTDKIT